MNETEMRLSCIAEGVTLSGRGEPPQEPCLRVVWRMQYGVCNVVCSCGMVVVYVCMCVKGSG